AALILALVLAAQRAQHQRLRLLAGSGNIRPSRRVLDKVTGVTALAYTTYREIQDWWSDPNFAVALRDAFRSVRRMRIARFSHFYSGGKLPLNPIYGTTDRDWRDRRIPSRSFDLGAHGRLRPVQRSSSLCKRALIRDSSEGFVIGVADPLTLVMF